MTTAEQILQVARGELGYKEAPAGSNRTKYGAWFGAPTTAWCAFFVTWCSNQADISTSVIPRIGNCAAMVNWYSQKGRYHRASGFEPRTGDLIFYSYCNNGRYMNISHVAIYVGNGKMVEAMDEDHGVVYGNYHNGNLVMIGRPVKK